MRITKAFWIWGQFSISENKYLDIFKKEAQSVLKSPKFETHITLAGSYKKIDREFLNNLETLALNNNSLNLDLKGFNFKEDIFKSFYIDVNYSENLKKLRKKICSLKIFDVKESYKPHISLSYGKHLTNQKIDLISKLPKLKSSIKMTRISIVDVDENINLWKILESYNLRDI